MTTKFDNDMFEMLMNIENYWYKLKNQIDWSAEYQENVNRSCINNFTPVVLVYELKSEAGRPKLMNKYSFPPEEEEKSKVVPLAKPPAEEPAGNRPRKNTKKQRYSGLLPLHSQNMKPSKEEVKAPEAAKVSEVARVDQNSDELRKSSKAKGSKEGKVGLNNFSAGPIR